MIIICFQPKKAHPDMTEKFTVYLNEQHQNNMKTKQQKYSLNRKWRP